jgi:peptidoglycan/LPS O-acetylase OafA/YrhL
LKRIPSLDGFRAISILLVLFHHSGFSAGFSTAIYNISRKADVGVTIFLVISGFLITNLLLNEEADFGKIDVKSFYIRRIYRIVPVYLLYILFIFIWRNIEPIMVTNSNLLHALTFTTNFDSNKGWFLAHFWSLSVEEQFYLFWPATLILCRKNIKTALAILVVYSCIARVIAYTLPALETITLSPFFEFSGPIFVGAFGGVLFFESPQILHRKVFSSSFAQLAALTVFIAFPYFTAHGRLAIISVPFGHLIISLTILFLIFAYILPSDKIVFKVLNNKAIVHIGVLSYSIYIWQQFFFIGEFRGIWRTFPYNILIIYVVSLISYYLWEKPFLKIKNSFHHKKLQAAV